MTTYRNIKAESSTGELTGLFEGEAVSLADVVRATGAVGWTDPYSIIIRPEGGRNLWWVTWKGKVPVRRLVGCRILGENIERHFLHAGGDAEVRDGRDGLVAFHPYRQWVLRDASGPDECGRLVTAQEVLAS